MPTPLSTRVCSSYICYVVDLIACARSTFGNDRILSSFFSFILTSNKNVHASSRAKKKKSWNFQEWFAQECFSAHRKLEYDASSVFPFWPASFRIAPEPPPIGPFGKKFNSINLIN